MEANNWVKIVQDSIIDIAISPEGTIFILKCDGDLALYWGYKYYSLLRSTDIGNTWVNINIIEQLSPIPPDKTVTPVNISISPSGTMFCGLHYVYDLSGNGTNFAFSKDDGLSWETPGWDIYGGLVFDYKDQYVITVGGLRVLLLVLKTLIYLRILETLGLIWVEHCPQHYPCALGIYLMEIFY